MWCIVSAADIPPAPASILKKKGSKAYRDAYYDAYHAPNPTGKEESQGLAPAPFFPDAAKKSSRKKQAKPEITPKFASEGFRVEKPSVQVKALALVSNKLSTSNAFSPAKQENVSDIASVSKNQALSNVSQYTLGTTKSQKKNWFSDNDKRCDEDWKEFKGNKSAFPDGPIYDTTCSEVGDGVIITPPPFRKAPTRDARELGLAKRGKSPAGIAAISKRKEKTRSELLKLPKDRESLKQKIEEEEQKLLKNLGEFHSRDARELGLAKKSKSVEPAGIAAISEQKRKIKSELFKPSKEARNNRNNNRNGDDWLIDEAFDNVVKAGKAVGKVAKATGKVAGKAIKEGFQATKKGIQGFNELSDEIVKNPMLVRMGQAHEAILHGMASKRRHALGSIAAVGANKRYVTAGGLVKQHGLVAHNNTTVAPQTATGLRVITKIVRRGNRDEVLYFLENGRQVTRNQARLIQEGILPPALENKASTTTEQAYSGNNTGSIMGKSAKSASGLVTRHNNGFGTTQTTTPRTIHQPKVASPSGLVTRTNNRFGNPVDDSQPNPVGVITKTATASGLVTRAKNGTGATKMSHNPVLNIAKIASPSRLMRRTHSGVV